MFTRYLNQDCCTLYINRVFICQGTDSLLDGYSKLFNCFTTKDEVLFKLFVFPQNDICFYSSYTLY